jgi:hypothetical protein
MDWKEPAMYPNTLSNIEASLDSASLAAIHSSRLKDT